MTFQKQATSFIDGLSSAARENPLAAALIGGGTFWLLMGGTAARGAAVAYSDMMKPAAEAGLRGVRDAASATTRVAAEAGSTLLDRGRGIASNLQESVGETAGSIKDAVTSAVDRTSDAVQAAPNPVPLLTERFGEARAALTDLLERQPLVLGALGLAIGAGIAGAVASTRIESEYAGAASDAVNDAIRNRAGEAAQTVSEAASEIGGDVSNAARAGFDKLRQTTRDAAKTVTDLVR